MDMKIVKAIKSWLWAVKGTRGNDDALGTAWIVSDIYPRLLGNEALKEKGKELAAIATEALNEMGLDDDVFLAWAWSIDAGDDEGHRFFQQAYAATLGHGYGPDRAWHFSESRSAEFISSWEGGDTVSTTGPWLVIADLQDEKLGNYLVGIGDDGTAVYVIHTLWDDVKEEETETIRKYSPSEEIAWFCGLSAGEWRM